jgi:hypothetical protein
VHAGFRVRHVWPKKCIFFRLQTAPSPCSFCSVGNIKSISTLDHARVTAFVSTLWNQLRADLWARNSANSSTPSHHVKRRIISPFGWLVADGWCWFVLREEYCWLVVGGWFVVREKYCWLVADKPSEQGASR